jgi:hypothetical protein
MAIDSLSFMAWWSSGYIISAEADAWDTIDLAFEDAAVDWQEELLFAPGVLLP